MARWLLTHAHYLNVVGDHAAQWEYKETDRKTKRVKRHTFTVPLHLDPEDEGQWTFRDPNQETGGIIVCWPGKGQPGDIEFDSPPTADMRPLDEEAKAETAKMSQLWTAKPDELQGSYGEMLADKFMEEFAKLRADQSTGPKIEGMTELLTAMTRMMEQNQQLIAALAKPVAERRI